MGEVLRGTIFLSAQVCILQKTSMLDCSGGLYLAAGFENTNSKVSDIVSLLL